MALRRIPAQSLLLVGADPVLATKPQVTGLGSRADLGCAAGSVIHIGVGKEVIDLVRIEVSQLGFEIESVQ